MSTVSDSNRATIDDLYETPGKAELVGGTLRLMAPTGFSAGGANTGHSMWAVWAETTIFGFADQRPEYLGDFRQFSHCPK